MMAVIEEILINVSGHDSLISKNAAFDQGDQMIISSSLIIPL